MFADFIKGFEKHFNLQKSKFYDVVGFTGFWILQKWSIHLDQGFSRL